MRNPFFNYSRVAAVLAICSAGTTSIARAAPHVTERFVHFTVPAKGGFTAVAECAPDEIVLSGGFTVDATSYDDGTSRKAFEKNPSDWYFVSANHPVTEERSWRVMVSNVTNRAEHAAIQLTCASGVSKSKVIAVGPHPIGDAPTTVQCPDGMVVTGGGWEISPIKRTTDIGTVKTSMPEGKDRWTVQVGSYSRGSTLNESTTERTAYAVCVSGLGGITSVRETVSLDLPANTATTVATGSGKAVCPPGQLFIGGGFHKPSHDRHVLVSEMMSFDFELSVTAHTFPVPGYDNVSAGPGKIELAAICMVPLDNGVSNTIDRGALDRPLPEIELPNLP